MHEVARFNQTFYPYACVLFLADCALRQVIGDGQIRGGHAPEARGHCVRVAGAQELLCTHDPCRLSAGCARLPAAPSCRLPRKL
ncbi:hypothetical protein BER93_15835 [Xanthomonas fragariae]|nr:hypothetical protein BER92_15795 [Xanthomonas fragariae]AOD19315.1 hypothetical protein BER93_15835 [Xanthomonas fragariae]ENZ93763.1 hypothetical protein O1K_19171 [Xanthomonas fragariae LMG 25863]